MNTRNLRSVLSRVLCNSSSVDSTFTSNHNLNDVESINSFDAFDVEDFLDDQPQEDVHRYLAMNKNENKAEVARQKILEHHFSQGADIQVFARM